MITQVDDTNQTSLAKIEHRKAMSVELVVTLVITEVRSNCPFSVG